MNAKGNGGQNWQVAKFKLCFTAVVKLIIFSGLICIRPEITKSEQQAICASVILLHFATFLGVQEDPDLLYESDLDSDDWLLVEGGGDSEVFEALGFQIMWAVAWVLGDG